MDALRAIQKTAIETREKNLIKDYSFEQALDDVLIYDDDGTVHTALLSIAATAGQQKQQAEKGLVDPTHSK